MEEYQQIWNEIKDRLQKMLSQASFEQNFSDVRRVVSAENGIVSILVPSSYIKHNINNIYYKSIDEIKKEVTNKNIRLKFVIEEEIKSKPVNKFVPLANNDLNLNQNFESFVVGDSNRLAYLTALKVAENPGVVLNPLYIFGGSGLGKTHLMMAIGNYIADKDVNYKIVYVQAHDFLNDYSKAVINGNNFQAFDEKYDNIDVLLIDDIQMLTNKDGTQVKFFNIFNSMDNKHKQIVITSDKPANKLNGFMDRLTTRFQMGGIVDINQPDLQQRINILHKKMEERSEEKFDDEVIEYIAENFTDNVRELEGALNRVIMWAKMYNKKPDLQMTKDALNIFLANKKTEPSSNYDNLLSVIASMYSISVADILGSSRKANIVLPRQIAMYILRTRYELTYSKIGNILNGLDHSTVVNGFNKIEAEIKTNNQLELAIEAIMKKV